MQKIFLILPLVCLILFLNCSDSSGPEGGNLTIPWTSVQSGDSLIQGAGLIVRFSAPLDLNSFQAQEIQTIYEILYSDSTGPRTYPIGQQVYKVVQAENIRVNDQPVTVWYHPGTNEVALFEETTLQMPFGTGEGLVIDRDSTEIVFKADIASQNGDPLGGDFRMYLHRAASSYRFRAVPNPAYPAYTTQGLQLPQANFNDLPANCVINIYDHRNLLMASLQHSGGGVQDWDLICDEGTAAEPDIFRYEISDSAGTRTGGLFVFPAFE